MPDNGELRKQMQRVERLLKEMEQVADPEVRERARLIVQGLMDLHGAALEAILGHIAESPRAGPAIIQSLAADGLVASVLLLYGLHPSDIETRVGQALEQARPLLKSHGGNVELIGLVDGVVRLRLQGSCHGCPSSAATLKNAIEEAIYSLAPDVNGIELEGEIEQAPHNGNGMPGEAVRGRIALPVMQG
jgi:Fe-S cluster biogenesis protein NfuA